MKSNGFSRRGLLMGAATLAVSRLKAADDTTLPTMELQQMAEGVSGASVAPPFAYVGCYTGGSNARGISVFHYDQVTNFWIPPGGFSIPEMSPGRAAHWLSVSMRKPAR